MDIKKHYEHKIKVQKIKIDLLDKAVKEEFSKSNWEQIQTFVEIINEERSTLETYENCLQAEISGERERRAKAKELLGIGG